MATDNKKGVGRNKGQAVKRDYKDHCRTMRTSGYVTAADGTWTTDYVRLRISDSSYKAFIKR